MRKQISSVIMFLALIKVGYGQNTLLVPEQDWVINHYQGSCYYDTIIHAVWLYIDPNQQLRKYQKDTSFVVVEITAVNKSPIDIYFHGEENKMRVPVIKEKFVSDTAQFNNNSHRMWGTLPMKMDKSLAFDGEDYLKNPHKGLWEGEKRNALIQIPKNTRKKLIVTIPKREGDYRIEAIVEFNRELYAFDCVGQKVSWEQFRTIESNKIELKKKGQ